ncbi:MAG: hypothetical protein H6944_00915 [Zoogloeaceae bacterium]|uniref:hypothetical protein n=1 Tax=Denitromonas sp. TaxID=2734609 RepID=UPI001D428F78|nr:hypothetical protein [Rhodocyclaceae bacterium]MCP5220238.1 hypothetical protein [Zoogloeaceae bacterium]
MKTWTDIISAAAVNNLGVAALAILAIFVLSLMFFREASYSVKAWVFAALFSAGVGFGAAATAMEWEKSKQAFATAHLPGDAGPRQSYVSGSCVKADGTAGRVQLEIAIFNKDNDKSPHGHQQDAVRTSNVWLVSTTQLSKVREVTSTWHEKRFGARWKCI